MTGYQWGWNYEYLNSGVSFFSRLDRLSDAARQLGSGVDVTTIPHYLLNVDNPLVVPVGTKVRMLVTASDVIHSWWVPQFGVKKDAIPGFVNEAWFNIDADKRGCTAATAPSFAVGITVSCRSWSTHAPKRTSWCG